MTASPPASPAAMPAYGPAYGPACGRAGFSLLEVLVALTIGAILAFLLAKTLGSAVAGSEGIERSRQQSRQLLTLRRLLHRDLQAIDWNQPVICTRNAVSFVTTHNHLVDGPLAVSVAWTAANGTLWRRESQEALHYRRDMPLLPGMSLSMTLEVYDTARRGWAAGEARLPPRHGDSAVTFIPEAFRITLSPLAATRALVGRGAQDLRFIERIPHALRPPVP